MGRFKFSTPVLFLIFNRLYTTQKVFEEIRKIKPKQLFIAADGPRSNKEKEKCKEVRNYVLKNIDWSCEIKTLFRRRNLGCKYAVSSAIDWFFQNVEKGIILEDDCLPNQSFFRFCQELLERYKNNDKIMSITGTNLLSKQTQNKKESYLFSKYSFIWGWATWKRAWEKNNLNINYLEIRNNFKKYYPNFIERILFYKKIKDYVNNKVDTWDIPWNIAHQMNSAFCIVPKVNLIENLGFSNLLSTHTKENKWDIKFLHNKTNELIFPLIHPKKIKPNFKFDNSYILEELKRTTLKKLF
ncbi:MAG: nucleotide-diphospho-sugar transferase [Candidatus Pacearchaeota archaeon]